MAFPWYLGTRLTQTLINSPSVVDLYAYLLIIFDVHMSSSVLHYLIMVFASCHVQGSNLMERKKPQ